VLQYFVVVVVVVGLEGGGSFGLKDDAVGCDGDCEGFISIVPFS